MLLSHGLKYTLSIVALTVSIAAFAESQNVIHQDVTLNRATVFLRGAELYNSTTLTLPAGQSEVVLSNVAKNINQKSLSIGLNNDDITIQSINFRTDFSEPVYSAEVKSLMSQIDEIEKEIEKLSINIEVNNEQIVQIKDQRFYGEENSNSLDKSAQKLNFIREQMTKLLNEQVVYQKQLDTQTEKLKRLNDQLENKVANIDFQKNQLVVMLEAKKAVTTQMDLSYITPDAAWLPTYDIRATDITTPITLTYKADIIQNSGINWDQVKLTLSSTDPSQSITPPQLFPWFITLLSDHNMYEKKSMNMQYAEASVPAPLTTKRKSVNKGIADYVSTDNSGINLSYQIDLPYTLPTHNSPRTLIIKQENLKAQYHYIATPKLNENIYLQAKVADWIDLNLLKGKANIYFANTYVGTYPIDPDSITEVLEIPFGIDKSIQISRQNNLKFKKQPSFMGSTIEQKESYLIKVKNLGNQSVELTVYDQIPVSQESNIVVTDIHYAEGKLDKQSGQVEWNVNLAAKQNIELPLNYTVNYPKNRHISGL